MHGIFFNQFFNKNKKCRMMAYQETCILPEYMGDFIKYCQKLFMGNEDDIKSFPNIKPYIVDLDELEESEKNGHWNKPS